MAAIAFFGIGESSSVPCYSDHLFTLWFLASRNGYTQRTLCVATEEEIHWLFGRLTSPDLKDGALIYKALSALEISTAFISSTCLGVTASNRTNGIIINDPPVQKTS